MRLFERRLILVNGKGGVGKTTIAASLATLAARAGLKVLLCELVPNGRLARLFGEKAAKRNGAIAENITLLFVDPEAALEEYLKIYVRIRRVYKPIVESPAMNYFFHAAPGFRELLIIGKIWWEVQLEEGRPRRHKWDIVIVDAPATGHGISFMGVSQAVTKMVRLGPIHKQAGNMVNTLQDKRTTALVTVTLPEEMPVNETADLINYAGESLGIPAGPVVVNGIPPQVFPLHELTAWRDFRDRAENDDSTSDQLNALVKLGRMGRARRELALGYRRELREKLPDIEMVDVPYLYGWSWDHETLNEVAGYLQRSLDL